jgi:hypothetical protein
VDAARSRFLPGFHGFFAGAGGTRAASAISWSLTDRSRSHAQYIEDLDRLHLDRRLAALTPLGVRLMESFSPPLASAETGRAPGEIRNVGERRDRVEGGAYRREETT